MTNKLFPLLLTALLWVPLSSLATEGGDMSTSTDTTLDDERNSGTVGIATIRRFLLSDGDPGASTTAATVFDTQGSGGTPSIAIFGFHTSTGCTAADTFTPQGSETNDLTIKYDLGPAGSTTLAPGQQMVVSPIVNRYLTATITDADASCTDAELTLQLIYIKGDER